MSIKFLLLCFIVLIPSSFCNTFSDDPYELKMMIDREAIPTITPKEFQDMEDSSQKAEEPKKEEPEMTAEDEKMQDVIEDLTENSRFLSPLTEQEKNIFNSRSKRKEQFRKDMDSEIDETLKEIRQDTQRESQKKAEKEFESNFKGNKYGNTGSDSAANEMGGGNVMGGGNELGSAINSSHRRKVIRDVPEDTGINFKFLQLP